MIETPAFGAWLVAARKKRGLSQARLALLTGIDRGNLSKIETGRVDLPYYETRQRIHAALGTTEAELIDLGIVRGAAHDGARDFMRQQAAQSAGEPSPLARALDAIWQTMNPEQRAFAKNVLDAALSVPRDSEAEREDRRASEDEARYKP